MKNLKDQIQSVVDTYKKGNLIKAENICKELLSKNPKMVFLYNLLGLIYTSQKKIDLAIKNYEEGIKIDPKFGIIYSNLGLIYFNVNEYKNINKAENYYKKSISVDGKNPEPYNNLGTLYNSVYKYNEAIESYKKAITIKPEFSFAHYNLGLAYITLGEFNNASKHLNKAIQLNQNLIEAHRTLSRIVKYKDNDEHFKKMENLYKDFNLMKNHDKINLCFALGKAHEDIKNYDKAFDFYKQGNSISRKIIKFDITNEHIKFENIKKQFNDKIFEKFKNLGSSDKSCIFIVGMPRSGTTLVEQILSNHPKVFGADEVEFLPNVINKIFGSHDLNLFFNEIVDFPKEKFSQIGTEYVSLMKNISENSERFTDKLPINFLSIGLIKLILPNSKVIHCYRNSRDTALSIYKNYFPAGKANFAYDLNEIVEYYNYYYELMMHWNKILPNFIFNIKYENLVLNTKEKVEKVLNFCDLEWSDNCINFHENKRPIRTASDIQARSKIYTSSINYWKNFDKHVNVFFEKLII